METDAGKLLDAGCILAKKTWEKTKIILQIKESDLNFNITHQVGKAHRDAVYKSIGLDVSKDISTFTYLGNTGSVSLPVTFSIAIDQNTFRKENLIGLMGIGSGINCMILGVKW